MATSVVNTRLLILLANMVAKMQTVNRVICWMIKQCSDMGDVITDSKEVIALTDIN